MKTSLVQVIARNIAVFALYYGAAKFGIAVITLAGDSPLTMIWLPAGIGLASLLVWGTSVIPAIGFAAFAALFPWFVEADLEYPIIRAFIFSTYGSVVDIFQSYFAFLVCTRMIHGDFLRSARNIVVYFGVGAIGVMTVTAALLVGGYTVGGYIVPDPAAPALSLFEKWFSITLSDAHGSILIAPLALAWITRREQAAFSWHIPASFAALFVVVLATLWFEGHMVYLAVPVLAWMALTLGVRAISVAVLILSATMTMGTIYGHGPFVLEDNPYLSLAYLTLMVISTSFMAYVLRAVTREVEQHKVSLESKVSERTEALELALEQAGKASVAKGEFLAVMSHEFRTPLNAILGMSDWLARQDLPEKTRDKVETIETAAGQLSAQVESILDFSSIEARSITIKADVIEVADLIGDIRKLFEESANERGLEFIIDVHDNVPVAIICDRKRLNQIIINLCSNAVKFTDAGKVSIRFSAVPLLGQTGTPEMSHELIVSVSDTGPGIPVEQWGEVFGKFVQVDSSHRRAHQGTGLGLAICTELSSAMGGKVELVMPELGGSTFELTLPIAVSKAGVKNTPKDIDHGHLHGDGVSNDRASHILIVEDSDLNMAVYDTLLEGSGITFDHLPDGRAVLPAVTEGRYSAVILDLHLPGADGFSILRTIRDWEAENSPSRPLLMILITADARIEVYDKARAFGADHVLFKPVRRDDFLALLPNHDGPEESGGSADLSHLMAKYKATLIDAIDQLQISLINDEMVEVEEIIHSIKGNAEFFDDKKTIELITFAAETAQKDGKASRDWTSLYKDLLLHAHSISVNPAHNENKVSNTGD